MLPLSPQLLWHDCFLGREERRGLKIQNREKECTQKSTRVSRSFSAPKTKLKKPHLPRQVIWLGYVPSHTLTPSPTCELSDAKTTFIPSKKKRAAQHPHKLCALIFPSDLAADNSLPEMLFHSTPRACLLVLSCLIGCSHTSLL